VLSRNLSNNNQSIVDSVIVTLYLRNATKEDEHSLLYIHDKATCFVNYDEVFKEE